MIKQSQSNIILSFDTTGTQDSIALFVGGVCSFKKLPQGGSALQSSILLPELQSLLGEHNLQLSDVDTLCVLTGPGSFTGIRLGLAAAQGIAMAVRCQIFAPTLLDLLHYLKPEGCAVIDSKRGDYFVKDATGVSVKTLEDVSLISQKHPIISADVIPGIEAILPQKTLAELLIEFFLQSSNAEKYDKLEPFYMRTPEFSKKKPFLS